MAIEHRRLALLTGVSLATLGIGESASAAVNPGIEHAVVSPNVDDTLTICAIDESCTFGVTNSGTGLVASSITDAANGEIHQEGTATGASPGAVMLHAINLGDAAILASATAAAAGGSATGIAFILRGIAQTGHGQGDVTLDFTNKGTLQIAAAAEADGPRAIAVASVFTGVHQFADSSGTGDALGSVSNSGAIAIAATAAAHGILGATAAATVDHGINEFVSALGSGNAFASLDNEGDIEVSADAAATLHGGGGTAYAGGFARSAVEQGGYAANGDVNLNIQQ